MAEPQSDFDEKASNHSGPNVPATNTQTAVQASEPEGETFNPGWRFIVAFLSLTTVTLMVALDATSISVALPIMAKKLGGTSIQAFWSGTSFLLTSTVFQPVIGSFSNIFGRKPMIFTSLLLFSIGAIVAGVANNFTTILIGRSLQGIGGGGIISLVEIVVTDLVPLRVRGQWFAFISSAWALGTVTGPLLGGGFAQNVSWRWIFYINLPFAGVGTVLIILFLRLNYETSAFMSKLRRVDWIGTVLFIASLTGFLIPLTWGGVMYPWDHWRTLVPLILSFAGLVVFVVWEEYIDRKGREPIIRFEVLKNQTAAVTSFGTFTHGMILWCILYYQPFYFEAIKGYSPILAGVALFPQTFTVAPASIVAGVIATITGKYRWATWSGWFLTTFGCGLLIYMDLNTSTPAWIFLNLVSGVGTGLLFTAMALAVQASASNANMSYAVVLFAFFRALGQTVGVAVGGVIFQNFMKRKLLTFPTLAPMASQYSSDASGLVELIKQMPASQDKTDLLTSYMHGLRAIYVMCTILAAISMVASVWTKSLPLDRAHESSQGFQHEKKKSDEEVVAAASK